MGKRRSDFTGHQRLNLDLVRDVSENAERTPQPVTTVPQTNLEKEKLNRTRRVLFTRTESKHHDDLLAELREELKLDSLNWSQVTRALWRLLEGDFDPDESLTNFSLKAPPTSELEANQKFERDLAAILYRKRFIKKF